MRLPGEGKSCREGATGREAVVGRDPDERFPPVKKCRPDKACRPGKNCQDAWRWATDSGGSTGWPATMRWQDASYAPLRCVCQGRGITRPYEISSGFERPGGKLGCKENVLVLKVSCRPLKPTNCGWARPQPQGGFRPKMSAFQRFRPCWKCSDNFYTMSLRNFSQESLPEIFGVKCATSAPLF